MTFTSGVEPMTMKYALVMVAAAFAFAIAGAGCGKKSISTAAGVIDPILAEWQKGDQTKAIKLFVDADWSRRPLFGSDSPLGMSEKQFAALPAADQQAKTDAFGPMLQDLRKLAQAVLRAGTDAAEKKDMATARTYITAAQRCGEALEHTDNME